ncbi:hypothetical protein [Lelliottia nimipressuralis]|uniref:hypothetical protein n=1 Tax=Lelliottia nimipressuralis TaxID=69220 RepID=UPI00141BC1B9|nr:hypothetical protein [Lelliottia nimipressuralis]
MWEDHIRSAGEKGHNINKDILFLEEDFLLNVEIMLELSKSDDDQEINTRAMRGQEIN